MATKKKEESQPAPDAEATEPNQEPGDWTETPEAQLAASFEAQNEAEKAVAASDATVADTLAGT
jgi:hypothetical protein